MDGDSHTAKAFSWSGHDEEDAGTAPPAFDPVAVMQAIEEEETDEAISSPTRAEADAPDLGAALRAAMHYDDDVPDDRDEPEETAAYTDAAGHDGMTEDWADDAAYRESQIETAGDAFGDSEGSEDDWAGFASGNGPGLRATEHHEAVEDEQLDPSSDDTDLRFDEDREPAQALHPGKIDESTAFAAPVPAPSFPCLDELDVPGRKPRIALMGEFSAGKSTLSNLLIGAEPLPMKVTATQLPPVWISWGDDVSYREDIDGVTHPVDLARLGEIDPAETRVIRIFAESPVLERCDIIDMPGISDPNMASEVWERVIDKADGVIWCTHATQAWRQSEASVWETLDAKLFENSLLLVTRFDKLLTETDRARVMRRVERETAGLFRARLPISLTRALAAGDDDHLLAQSGAAAFRESFASILDRLAQHLDTDPVSTRMQDTLSRDGMVTAVGTEHTVRSATPSRVLPRRVRPVSEMARPNQRDTSGL